MRFVGAVVAFASVASAFTPASPYDSNKQYNNVNSSVDNCTTTSIHKTSIVSTTTTSTSTSLATVTVKGTRYGAKATSSSAKASPSAKVGKPFGYKNEDFQYNTENTAKLQPCTHWTHDTKNPKNLVPTVVGDKTQLYYAEDGDAREYV